MRTTIGRFCSAYFVMILIVPALEARNDTIRDAQDAVEKCYNDLRELHDSQASTAVNKDEVEHLIRECFDFQRFAPQAIQQLWEKLNAGEQRKFKLALVHSMANNLAGMIYVEKGNFPQIHLTDHELRGRMTKLIYELTLNGRTHTLTIFLAKTKDGRWQINEIKRDRENLQQYYYKFCKNLLDDYSFEYLLGELLDAGYIPLEDFETSEDGQLPYRWNWKSKDNDKNKPYRVHLENGNKYLAATDTGQSVIIGKDLKWNLKKYPYISFRLRGKKIPRGGDERYGRTVDSAAGLYLVYKKKFGLIPESIKYVWSSTLPVGSVMRRSGTGRPWMLVVESGEDNVGKWRTYVFNAYEAYKQTFGGDPPDTAIGIGILSDANSTDSKAYADYDDIRAVRQADADSGIKEFLKAE